MATAAAMAGQALPADKLQTLKDSLAAKESDSSKAAADQTWELAGDDGTKEAVRYQGQRIDYLVDRELIMLTGRARVRYKDIRVEGDSISLDTRRQVLTVSRDPVLYDKEDAIYGDRMVYNFRTRRGWIYNGFTKFERGRYWGRRIRQVGERTLNVDYGRYTTCDAEEPHYYFWARRMKLYLDDKMVAQPVAVCFSGIPVVVVPFWILPLRHDRHSGFLMPRFGTSAYEGVYVKNLAYYQVIDERSDVTVSGDYLEFIGWRGNLEGRFASADRISTQANFSYLEDRRQLQKRWSLNADYNHRLGRKTRATGRADFLSDTRYRTDFSDDLNARLDRNLRSYLAVNHSWSTGGLATAADHSHNLDLQTKNTRLPEVSANLYRIDLPGRLAGVSGSSYFINTGSSGPAYRDRHQGWDNSADLSSSFALLRHISISPRASFRATWYDRDTSGRRNVIRWLYSGGISAGTTLYGILPLKLGPLMGLRHVVQPSVTFSYAPRIDQGRYHMFGSIGRMGEQKSLGLALGNTFQAKFRQGDKNSKIDLLSVSSSAGYNYLAAEKRWSGISTNAALLPGNRYLDLRLSSYYDVYRRQSEYTNLDASFRLSGAFGRAKAAENDSLGRAENKPGRAAADTAEGGEASESMAANSVKSDDADTLTAADSMASGGDTIGLRTSKPDAVSEGLPWNLSLGLSQNWRTGQGVAQSLVRGAAEANLTKNWKVSYSQYYDLRQRQMVSQEYSIYRDLHCWEARFSSTKSGIYWFYEFRINLKAIPEFKLQLPKSGRATY
jgi:lipopolysaccharide assembly outer membrane protein LptD (OstA)